ncbi:DUF411 domain-containing protein [Chromobacterium haemolyticum]|uniref:DUF411 domain-containing protein n=1 Tax=Chromobacterium haemolyticum TaxID=394935 RepID=UPI00244B379A|nr:DUF411 domain-containing protein [Chromobacterium haemolyticum]MDH0342060.1 CopG family transcriptional regulator [Chromobacterium haemolyticum]
MKHVFRMTILALLLAANTVLAAAIPATMYRSPDCSCCEKYAAYLKANGFAVKVVDTPDMKSVKKHFGSDRLSSCHTMIVGGYVVEGHVPVAAIRKLLQQRPAIVGISVPGMPTNSPGMGPEVKGTLRVMAIEKNVSGAPRLYSVE